MGIRYNDAGQKVRVSKMTGAVIPPAPEKAVRVTPRSLAPGPADTPAEAAAAVTYAPPPELLPFLSRPGTPASSPLLVPFPFPAQSAGAAAGATVRQPQQQQQQRLHRDLSIYRTRKVGDPERKPRLFSRVDLRRGTRNRLLARWRRRLERELLPGRMAARAKRMARADAGALRRGVAKYGAGEAT